MREKAEAKRLAAEKGGPGAPMARKNTIAKVLAKEEARITDS